MPDDNPYAAPQLPAAGEAGFLDLSGPLPDFEACEPVRIEFSLTIDDLAEFTVRIHERNGVGGLRQIVGWGAVLVAAVVAFVLYKTGVSWDGLRSLAFLIVPLALLVLLGVWRGWGQMDKEALRVQLETSPDETLKVFVSHQKATFSPAGCHFESELYSSLFRWPIYREVVATTNACYLLEGRAVGRLVPSRAFASEAEYLDFVRRAAGQVRKAQASADSTRKVG